jgi:excisionase family DNA binding protein
MMLTLATPLLTPAEAARLLGVSRSTMYRLVERGAVPVLRVGGQLRFEPEQLAAAFRTDPTPRERVE